MRAHGADGGDVQPGATTNITAPQRARNARFQVLMLSDATMLILNVATFDKEFLIVG